MKAIGIAALIVVALAWLFTLAGSAVGMILAITGVVLGAIGCASHEGRDFGIFALVLGVLLILIFRVVVTVKIGFP